jgi:hypothetical protein
MAGDENLCTKLLVKPLHVGGRKNGDNNLSPMMRTLIGAAAELDGNNAKVARTFGVSDRAVANYKVGRTSHSTAIEPAAASALTEVIEKGQDRRAEAKEKAIDRLASLFDGPISEENLSTLKPREAISAAKDLATVIDRVTPKDQNVDNRVQFVVFAPRQKTEKEYEAIDINAREIN